MQKKRKTRLNFRNSYKKKQLLIVLILVACMLSFVVVLGRYVTNNVENFFVRSKEFYFYSDKLSENLSTFQIDNWSGVDEYVITINMNSIKNNLLTNSYDIGYDITYTCSENAICQASKTSGIINSSTNSDYFNLTITPNTQLETGDKVTVYVEATSTDKYQKTLKGKFTLVVGKENLSYQITDAPNDIYMELSITNTLSYYIVNEAFDSYTAGQKIDIDTYLSLTDTNKAKCYSSIVTIEFNPNDILIDLTNENYSKVTNIRTTQIDGNSFVSGFTISIDAISSINFRFYKVDVTEDYSYPGSNQSPIVTLTSQ